MTLIPFPETRRGCGCAVPDWLTLPLAPQAVARSRFRGEDSLPQAVPFQGALSWIKELQAGGKNIAGLDVHGPGDPLATLDMTRRILISLREQYPEMSLGLTTLGFGLAEHASQLAEHGVARVTLLVDAVSPEKVEKMYSWIRPAKRNTPLAKGAEILIDEQAKGVAACKAAGITVLVQATVYAGINEQEALQVARWAAGCGVESLTLLAGKGWLREGEPLRQLPVRVMEGLAADAGRHLPCVCLQEPAIPGGAIMALVGEASAMTMPKPTAARPNVAVLSSNGMDIDLHLGQAVKALIYGPRADGLACLLKVRNLPEPGGGDARWLQVAEILADCFVLLAASAGSKPRDILERQGLPLLLLEDSVDGTVDVLYGGGKKGKGKR